MRFLSALTMMMVLRAPADEGGAGGGAPAAAPAADKPAPAAEKPAARTFTQDEVNAIVAAEKDKALTKGQKAILSKLKAEGFDVEDEDKLVALVKSGEEARKAKQTEIERASEEAKSAKKTAEERAAELAKTRAENAKLRVMLEAKPADVELFDALYDKASREDGFDAKKWVEEQKAKRPALFGGDASPAPAAGQPAKGATTTTAAGAGTQTTAGNGARVNAMDLSGDALRDYERSLGINR